MTKHLIPAPPEVETVGRDIVDSAFQIHSNLGPGLLETTHELCLEHELLERGRKVQRQMALPVTYKGRAVETPYRVDLMGDAKVIV